MLDFFRRLLASLPGRSDDRAKTAPLSEKQIESIEFTSARTEAGPVLVAVSGLE